MRRITRLISARDCQTLANAQEQEEDIKRKSSCNPMNYRTKQMIRAERQGFEPWVPVRVQRFSRPSRSTTPASFPVVFDSVQNYYFFLIHTPYPGNFLPTIFVTTDKELIDSNVFSVVYMKIIL